MDGYVGGDGHFLTCAADIVAGCKVCVEEGTHAWLCEVFKPVGAEIARSP
jgi:hypothetical protein